MKYFMNKLMLCGSALLMLTGTGVTAVSANHVHRSHQRVTRVMKHHHSRYNSIQRIIKNRYGVDLSNSEIDLMFREELGNRRIPKKVFNQAFKEWNGYAKKQAPKHLRRHVSRRQAKKMFKHHRKGIRRLINKAKHGNYSSRKELEKEASALN